MRDLRQDQVVRIIFNNYRVLIKAPALISYYNPMQREYSQAYQQYLQQGKKLSGLKIRNYLFGQQIGEGKFGKIYKTLDFQNETLIITKLLDIEKIRNSNHSQEVKQKKIRYVEKEDEIMNIFHHPNLVPCLGTICFPEMKLIMMPFYSEGTLHDILSRQGYFEEELARDILRQITHAVIELHSKGIVHRDISLKNIFARNGRYILGDFGLAKKIESIQAIQTECGTAYSQAPEVKEKKYDGKVDIWSLGVIFYLLVWQSLSLSNKIREFDHLKNSKQDFITSKMKAKLSPQSISFIQQSLVEDPAKRIGLSQLISHPIFAQKETKQFSAFFIIPEDQPSQIYESNTFEIEIEKDQEEAYEFSLISQIPSKIKTQPQLNPPSFEKIANPQHEMKKAKQEQETIEYRELQNYHLRILRAQFVLNEMIIPIEASERFQKINGKTKNKLMYLLSSRSYFQIYRIPNEAEKFLNSTHFFFNFKKLTGEKFIALLEFSKQKLNFYKEKLTEVQSRYLQWFKWLVKGKQEAFNYERIFTGIQGWDFSRAEQIKATQEVLKNIIENLDDKFEEELDKILNSYGKIMQIELSDLWETNFDRMLRKVIR